MQLTGSTTAVMEGGFLDGDATHRIRARNSSHAKICGAMTPLDIWDFHSEDQDNICIESLSSNDIEGINGGGTCRDCNGDAGGTASYDNCGVCVGGETGLEAYLQDCNQNWGGLAYIDECNVCVGGNTGLTPCTIVSITHISREDGITIFPKPYEGSFTISCSDESCLSSILFITDMTGKVLLKEALISPHLQLNIPDLESGIYFIKIGSWIKKVVKM